MATLALRRHDEVLVLFVCELDVMGVMALEVVKPLRDSDADADADALGTGDVDRCLGVSMLLLLLSPADSAAESAALEAKDNDTELNRLSRSTAMEAVLFLSRCSS